MAELKKKLLNQVRDVRLKNFSIKAEDIYVMWMPQFTRSPKNQHPSGNHPSFLHTFFATFSMKMNGNSN